MRAIEVIRKLFECKHDLSVVAYGSAGADERPHDVCLSCGSLREQGRWRLPSLLQDVADNGLEVPKPLTLEHTKDSRLVDLAEPVGGARRAWRVIKVDPGGGAVCVTVTEQDGHRTAEALSLAEANALVRALLGAGASVSLDGGEFRLPSFPPPQSFPSSIRCLRRRPRRRAHRWCPRPGAIWPWSSASWCARPTT